SPAARALGIAMDALLGAAAGAVSTLGGWLVSFWKGLKSFHAQEWAGARVALVVATGLVLINMKHPAAPILRDHALEQRARQTAGRETDELRGAAPQAGGETVREDKDRSRAPMRREIAPPALPPQQSAPSAGGVMKQPPPS